jgi:hypothetical protein
VDGTVSAQEKADFAKIFLLNTFREEMDHFLQDLVQRSFSDANWNSFLVCFLHVIEDCPLICRADNATLANVDEVFIVRDGNSAGETPDGSPPAIIWGLCFKGELKMPIGANFTISAKLIDTLVALSESRELKSVRKHQRHFSFSVDESQRKAVERFAQILIPKNAKMADTASSG